MKLFFCQNDCPIRGEFWQKNIAHILFELCPVQIIITHPLLRKMVELPTATIKQLFVGKKKDFKFF